MALAIRSRADLEQRINGQSALDCAAHNGHLGCLELLLAGQAQPSQTAPMRWTPLMRAAQGDHLEICLRLLDATASPDEYGDLPGRGRSDKCTALDVAEVNG